MKNQIVDEDSINSFQHFLMGGPPPGGIQLSDRPPALDAHQGMAVIYVLQEFLKVIPDTYELCEHCQWVFDTDQGGHVGDNGEFFCDNCSFLCKCERCTSESA